VVLILFANMETNEAIVFPLRQWSSRAPYLPQGASWYTYIIDLSIEDLGIEDLDIEDSSVDLVELQQDRYIN